LPATNETHAAAFGTAWTLATALPPDGSNPIGTRTRAGLVLKMLYHLPEIFNGKAEYIRELGVVRQRNQEDVRLFRLGEERVSVDQDLWRSFSIAVYSDFIYKHQLSIWRAIDVNKVREDLTTYNSKLGGARTGWYALMAGEVDGMIKTALAAIPETERPAARQNYMTGLTSDAYITLMATRYNASGSWSNRDWDLFHHWIKLKALSASDDEIDRTITAAKGRGLPVPDDLQAGAWRGWSKWFGADFDGSDLKLIPPTLETYVFLMTGPGQIYNRIPRRRTP
jgi:hypothetical protein